MVIMQIQDEEIGNPYFLIWKKRVYCELFTIYMLRAKLSVFGGFKENCLIIFDCMKGHFAFHQNHMKYACCSKVLNKTSIDEKKVQNKL